jgi:hypothetical protein
MTAKSVQISAKTVEEHHATLVALVRLQFHWLHRWLCENPSEDVTQALHERVDIWRKTDLNPGGLVEAIAKDEPLWQGICTQIHTAWQTHRQPDQRDAFEAAAFACVEQRIANRVQRDFDYEQQGLHMQQYNCGSLRYHRDAVDGKPAAFLHIANAIAPQSIFADRAYLRAGLMQVMDLAEREGITLLRTHTWLNSHPTWLSYFPSAWQEHMSPPDHDVQWHYGFWGQFLNARSCFHARLAAQLRQTGEFPYPPRSSWCTVTELREYLRKEWA